MLTSKSLISTSLTLVALIASCGSKKDEPTAPAEEILPQISVPDGDVRWLPLQDPDCLKKDPVWSSPPNATIYEWNGTATNSKIVPFSWSKNEETQFATTRVLASAINYEINKKCSLSSDGVKKCEKLTSKSESIEVMKLCRSDANYQRHSLEAMALTSLHYTESAYSFYNSIRGSLPGIPQSILLIQPKISYEITKPDGKIVTKFDADNASFSEVVDETKKHVTGLFTVYPTSKKSFLKSGLNLWEVPFVMRHEFGHHVFSHYVKESAEANGLSVASHDRLEAIMKSPEGSRRKSLGLTASNDIAQLALDGINETFADLYGYFAGNSAKDQLKGVECLDISRDPSSPKTKAGSLKGINKSRIDIYEGRADAPTNNTDCYEPSYDSEHDIATALAHPLAKFIEAAKPNSQSAERGALLLEWAARMERAVQLGRSNINTDVLVRELILSAKLSGEITAACRDLKPIITGLPLSTQTCGG